MTILKNPEFSAQLAQQVYRILDLKDKNKFSKIALDDFSESLETNGTSLQIGQRVFF